MSLRPAALLPLALAALFASCATAPAPSPSSAAAPTAVPAKADDGPELTLVKGMTAAQVRQIMGEPAEIRPRPVSEGTAEVWIYSRTSVGSPQQIEVGMHPITVSEKGADGIMHERVVSQEPIYRLAHVKTVETIQLLMINGLYLEHRTTAQQQQEFD